MFYLFHLFRSFLPLHNPIGFGAPDFIELAVAFLLVSLALVWRSWIEFASRLASKTALCMLILATLPIALRLILLPVHPIPTPMVSDEMSYVLLGDTLSHFRLTNPPHPLHQFFETYFVLQEPTYSSIYPLGQGIALAFGKVAFHHPWAGVALSIGAFCALCYWMLRGWTTPGWALVGGLLAVMEFGPLNQWMNSYWGGGVSAVAGALAFGALPRLRESGRMRHAVILGAGLGLQLLARPFESIFLLLSILLYFLPAPRKVLKFAPAVILTVLPAIGLILLHNYRVTGSPTTLPYMHSRYQYGIPTVFVFQANPVPHRELTHEQQLDYDLQSYAHQVNPPGIRPYFARLASRVRFYRFFFLAPLYLVLPMALFALRDFRYWWVVLTLCLFALGTNIYPYFFTHYLAAETCLFVLISVTGLQQLSRVTIRGQDTGADAARVILFLCVSHFVFWYGLHLFGNQDFAEYMWRYETWDAMNHGDPEEYLSTHQRLTDSPGKQLVFVRYGPSHTVKEWVFNDADIDGSKVVWARDLGEPENEKLRRYYPNRTAWLLEPDAKPVVLVPYQSLPFQTTQKEQSQPEPAKPDGKKIHPPLKFEEVH